MSKPHQNVEALEALLEAQLRKATATFLRQYPLAVDEAQRNMLDAFAGRDENTEAYRNSIKEEIPDQYGDINPKVPGEMDGKADAPSKQTASQLEASDNRPSPRPR